MSVFAGDGTVFKLPRSGGKATQGKPSTKPRAKACKKNISASQKEVNPSTISHRRITRSTSKNSLLTEDRVLSETSPTNQQGAVTRNRSRMLNNRFDTQIVSTLRSGSADSGYCTSDGSREYTESVVSSIGSSRESIGLSDSVRSWDNPDDLSPHFKSPDGCSNVNAKNKMLPEVILLREGSVYALVPLSNSVQYHGPFIMQIDARQTVNREILGCMMRVHHVSPVVSLAPNGLCLHESLPAILVVPIRAEPRDEAWLHCLGCDKKGSSWRRLPRRDFYYRNGCVVLTTRQLGLFTAILEEPYPEIHKKIRCRTGGRLRMPDVPGIEVNFPRGCLEHDIEACLRVLFDNEPTPEKREMEQLPLASPIISLGPHGLDFNEQRLPVLISLPIPDYQNIMTSCPNALLVAYESSTADHEPMVWQRIAFDIPEPTVIGYRHGITGRPIPTVTFPVHHFSFFKVVWDLLSTTVYEAKMGMSYFYPYISFSMMCQAFMEESHENNRFGLEVICYRSDRKLPETTNYRHRVGASLKPKLVRPGRISVRLRSQMFEADVEAGEDSEMVKEEPDFRGRDFEKQYACRFKPDSNVERGTFGKVIVERIATKNDPLFEFNLHKTGIESSELPPAVGCERWTVFAMKELASSLQITENNNWKQFAKFIGFTKSEIKNKLTYTADPFLALMNLYNSRGGTPEEFIQALYVVSREIRLGGATTTGSPDSASSRSSNQSGGSSSRDSGSHSQDSKDSPMKRLWRFRPWGGANNQESDSADSNPQRDGATPGGSGRKRSRPSTDRTKSGSAPAVKRRRFSDASETIQSSSEDGAEMDEGKTVSTENHRSNGRRLSDKDLWRISSGIARKDWRNLGRTLGIEEIVLGNLEHSHQSVGFRECAYQMLLEWKGRKPKKCTFGELYSALNREKMVSVAKFMVRKIAGLDEGQEEHSDSN